MPSLDLDAIATQAASQVGIQLTEKLRRSLKSTLRTELKVSLSTGLQAFKSKLLEQFDTLSNISQGGGSAIVGQDPTALVNVRGAFEQSISKDLNNVSFEGDIITISVGNTEEWGLEYSGEIQNPLEVLGIWINGNVGSYGFISDDQYALRRTKDIDLGHFGTGFMISEERYKIEGWEKITKLSFAQIRHPISGQPPFTGFNDAAESFDWSPYVCEAIQKSFTKILA